MGKPAGTGRGDTDRKGTFRTINANLCKLLRNDILDGRLEPGDKLRFDDLRRRYAATVSPLREALMRLASDGLVVLEEHKGFRVAMTSRKQLEDITSTRRSIDPIAIERSIALGDEGWEGQVAAAFGALSAYPMEAASGALDEGWEERHRQFHESLYAACDSVWLSSFCRLLYDQGERYRRLWFRRFGNTRNVLEEHRTLMQAVVSRDAEAAAFYIRRHISQTTASLLTVMPETPSS